MLRLLKTSQFDVIIFHDVWLAYSIRRKLRDPRARMFVTGFIHDDNTTDMPGAFRINGASLSYFVRWVLERFTIPKLNIVLTNSDYLKDEVRNAFGTQPDVRRVYYAAHDYTRIRFQPRIRTADEPLRILFVKNDFIRGGLPDLLSALQSLPDWKCILTIVGPEEKLIYRKVDKTLLQLPHVQFAMKGRVTSQSEMLELYYDHDICCIPSRREALGLANAEALACGTAVVTTRSGGIPEVMDNGNNGYVCTAGAPDELATQIRACIHDPVSAMEKRRHGREFVLQKFELDSMFRILKEAFLAVDQAIE